ncbi:hypothetical protein [Saccharicrinis carchari]|uniref:hypothetical protein n=1 Tax=Saccharicrinis carchari TaxID=1168039 RepID=UPI00163D9629|nr:hypothetical protein [Saccharicrinis carchari]
MQRQQVQANIGVRKKIVKGLAGIVQMVLNQIRGKLEVSSEWFGWLLATGGAMFRK